MDEVYRVEYVDAYYIYEDELGETKLSPHEAFGYVERKGDSIVIRFIKKVIEEGKPDTSDPDHIPEGLVIPDTALLSINKDFKLPALDTIRISSSVIVTWRDVVHVGNMVRTDCSVMYTEGILHRVEDDHVVIKDPETIRTYPLPIANHPGGKPTYLVIPKSFITEIKAVV